MIKLLMVIVSLFNSGISNSRLNDMYFLESMGGRSFADIEQFVVKDSIAYILAQEVDIINISDPQHPRIIGRIYPNSHPYSIALKDSYLYLSCSDEFLVIDVSNPSDPHILRRLSNQDLYSFTCMHIDGNLGFGGKFDGGIYILDLSDPMNPGVLGHIPYHGWVHQLTSEGNYLYSAEDASGLWIYDISNPSAPHVVGHFDDTTTNFFAYVVGIKDSILIGGDDRIYLLNVSDPSNPYYISFLDLGNEFPEDIYITGSHVFIPYTKLVGLSVQGFFKLVDISDPHSPFVVLDIASNNGGYHIQIQDSLLFCSDPDTLHIFNISEFENPVEIGNYTTSGRISVGMELSVIGRYAFVAAKYGGVRIFDVSNPRVVHEVGSIVPGYPVNLVSANDSIILYTYNVNSTYRLAIANISDPRSPMILDSFDLQDPPIDLLLKDSLLFILSYSRFDIYNISNPSNPAFLGEFYDPCGMESFSIQDSIAILTYSSSGGGIKILDLSNLSNPVQICDYDTVGFDPDVVYLQGNIAFLAGVSGQNTIFYSLDISNPSNPEIIGSLILISYGSYQPVDLTVHGNLAYILYGSDYQSQVVDVSNPESPIIGGYFVPGVKTCISDSNVYVLNSFYLKIFKTKYIPVPELISPRDSVILNNNMPSLVWSVPDPQYWSFWVYIHRDGTFEWDSVEVSGDTVYTFTNPLEDGDYRWTVRTVAPNGARGEYAPLQFFSIDTRAPNIPLLVSPVNHQWVRDTIVDFHWSRVTLKNAPVKYVIMIENNSVVIHDTVDTNFYETSLNEGIYQWRIMAFDVAGNSSDWSYPDTFGVDVTPPEIDSVSYPGDTCPSNDITVSCRVNDNLSGVGDVFLFYSIDGSDFDSTGMMYNNGFWTGELSFDNDSTNHSVRYFVKAYDIAGNYELSDTFECMFISVSEYSVGPEIVVRGFSSNPVICGNPAIAIYSHRNLPASISVFDVRGRRVYHKVEILKRGENKVKLHNTIPGGIYFIEVKVEDKIYRFKLLYLN